MRAVANASRAGIGVGKGDAVGDPEVRGERLVMAGLLGLPDHMGGELAAVRRFELGDRLEENVDALEVAQHAEKQEVAGVVLRGDRRELGVAQSVADDCGAAPRYADLLAVDLGLVGADMDEGVGHPLQHALDAEIEHAFERALVVMQAAAMGRIDAGDRPPPAEPCGDQPPVGAALGAMAMQDIGNDLAEMLEHPAHRHEVAQRDAAPHRKARGAERELRA